MASEIVVNEFVEEAREHLANTERDLLVMEKCCDSDAPGALNRVFRAIHSIKGASGTFGFPAVNELSHAMESVLLLIRDGKMTSDADKVNALLEGVDRLRFMIEDIHASHEVDCQSELRRLKALVQDVGTRSAHHSMNAAAAERESEASPKGSAEMPSEISSPIALEAKDPLGRSDLVFSVDRSQIASVLSTQQTLCVVRLPFDRESERGRSRHEAVLTKMRTYGQCLDTRAGTKQEPHPENTPSSLASSFLFATILEPDLIAAALETSDEQIQVLSRTTLEELLREQPEPPDLKRAASIPPSPAPSVKAETGAGPIPETIRVNVELLDSLINLAGELVLGRNQLRQMLESSADENPRLRTVIQSVNLVTSEMQERILRMRMQPLHNLLNRLRRLVRDLACKLSKEVDLVIEAGEVELDKSILEGLTDPLTHLIRNCVDHGIEPPAERIAKGKPSAGEIRLRAFHQAGQVNITVSDDGRGMATDQVLEKAIAKGILSTEDARRMTHEEKVNLVFLPGFSTARTVTDVSGRGVGMDVVKHNIDRFGGHIEIESVEGSGVTFRLTIPLTLAIIPSLIVGAANQRFAIPQVNVRELVCIQAEDRSRRIEKVGEALVLRLRDRLLPLVRLAETVGLVPTFSHPGTGEEQADRRVSLVDRRQRSIAPEGSHGDRRRNLLERRQGQQSDLYVVVLRAGGNVFGLIVDELFDIEEIVVKPLSSHIKDCQCFAGATIMGDGRVAMILDAGGIASLARLRFAEVNAEQVRRQAEVQWRHKGARAERQSILVFRNTLHEQFALPLSSISRLERIVPSMLERIGTHEFIAYGGKPLPLMRLENYLSVRPLPESLDELYVIIPKKAGSPVGILVCRIVDTIESEILVEKAADRRCGFLGSAVVEGQITMFLDMDELLALFQEEMAPSSIGQGIAARR